MAGQPEIDAIPNAGELRVVVHLLRVKSDTRQEPECLAEILELEAPDQRLAAIFFLPSIGCAHPLSPVLQLRFSLKRPAMTSGHLDRLQTPIAPRAPAHERPRARGGVNLVNFQPLEMAASRAQLGGKGE